MSQDPQHPDDERVARLLADARHTEPLPADVAARLDRALVGLVAEVREASEAPVAPVVDLASRRRRRLTTGLVAAAAFVAIGVGLPSLIQGDSTDQASTTADDSGGEAAEREFSSEDPPAAGDAAPEQPSSDAQLPESAQLGRLEISPDRFKRDARAARNQASYDTLARPEACGDLPADAERVVPVRYADREGYLVFGVPATDRQQVSLYLCPEGSLTRQVTIPVR